MVDDEKNRIGQNLSMATMGLGAGAAGRIVTQGARRRLKNENVSSPAVQAEWCGKANLNLTGLSCDIPPKRRGYEQILPTESECCVFKEYIHLEQ